MIVKIPESTLKIQKGHTGLSLYKLIQKEELKVRRKWRNTLKSNIAKRLNPASRIALLNTETDSEMEEEQETSTPTQPEAGAGAGADAGAESDTRKKTKKTTLPLKTILPAKKNTGKNGS